MKTFALILGLLSFSAFSTVELSYQTNIKVNKTVMDADILLKNLLKLQTHLDFENIQMLAAEEISKKKHIIL